MALLYDADGAAAETCTKASWWREAARQRRIPFVMIGNSYRWTADQIAEVITAHTVRPQDAATSKHRAPRVRKSTGEPMRAGESNVLTARTPRRKRVA